MTVGREATQLIRFGTYRSVFGSGHQLHDGSDYSRGMVSADRAEFNRLVLQCERDVAAEAALSRLLRDAHATAVDHRQGLRHVAARLQRTLVH